MSDNETKISALQERKKEIEACDQDWMREDRLAQLDKEIAGLRTPAAPAAE